MRYSFGGQKALLTYGFDSGGLNTVEHREHLGLVTFLAGTDADKIGRIDGVVQLVAFIELKLTNLRQNRIQS